MPPETYIGATARWVENQATYEVIRGMENATLRPFRVRDPSWLVERYDTLYARDEGFDEPKFSSWSKTELWQVVDVEPMPVFGKFYNG